MTFHVLTCEIPEGNCGVAAVCTLERRGIKCSSAADREKRESWTGLVSGLAA